MVGNHLMQELVLLTGALDAMVVDYQCIMPSVTDVAKMLPHGGHINRGQSEVLGRYPYLLRSPSRGLEIGKEDRALRCRSL